MFDINVLFCLIVVFHSVIAVVAPLPKVTPAALLPREDITTFAWYATTDDDGSTTCMANSCIFVLVSRIDQY